MSSVCSGFLVAQSELKSELPVRRKRVVEVKKYFSPNRYQDDWFAIYAWSDHSLNYQPHQTEPNYSLPYPTRLDSARLSSAQLSSARLNSTNAAIQPPLSDYDELVGKSN